MSKQKAYNKLPLKEVPYITPKHRPVVRQYLLDGILPGLTKGDERVSLKQRVDLFDNDIIELIGQQKTKARKGKFKTSTKGAAYLVKTTTFALPEGQTEAELLLLLS